LPAYEQFDEYSSTIYVLIIDEIYFYSHNQRGRPQGGEKGAFGPLEIWTKEPKFSRKAEVSSLIPID